MTMTLIRLMNVLHSSSGVSLVTAKQPLGTGSY